MAIVLSVFNSICGFNNHQKPFEHTRHLRPVPELVTLKLFRSMEPIVLLVGIIMVIWTNEKLLGKSLFTPSSRPSKEEKLAEALKNYLEDGIKTKDK